MTISKGVLILVIWFVFQGRCLHIPIDEFFEALEDKAYQRDWPERFRHVISGFADFRDVNCTFDDLHGFGV